MTSKQKFSVFFLIAACLAVFLSADNFDPARHMVRKIDELYRASSSRALMEMQIFTPHWQRTLKIRSWSQGMDKTFLRILEPLKEKGMATLRMGNEMWNYLPKTDKVMKIPPSMMMGSWMGSDFTNDDLVKEYTFLNDYTFAITSWQDAEPGLAYVKCVPKPDRPIIWGHIILAIQQKTMLPKWEKFFDEKGRLMREITFSEIKTFGKRTIPATMTMVPVRKKGKKTIVRYLDAQFDFPVSRHIFSLRNLRSRD